MKRLICARIDTGALRANLATLKSRAPHCKVMAVIKANAYGHGLVSTALALPAADAFAVARVEEAVALRAAGVAQPIVLLEGVFNFEQLAEAAHLQLELVVHEFEQIALLEQFHGTYRFAVWLKVDTGMNRLGFSTRGFAAAFNRLRSLQPALLDLRVLTHLARADEREHPANREQLQRLNALTDGINAQVSIANSAGVLAWPESHAQWIRPGLALYGVSPFENQCGAELGLRPAMQLESTVIALRQVESGQSVGYGGAWTAQRRSLIAIVAGGYGDGLLRSSPSGTEILIAGHKAPLVGRVSMDMSAVDITDLPPVNVGDAVELWGARLPVEQLARAAGTIPYELLCGVSQRVPLEIS